ncbi:Late [Abeliophyllum distichum]|uniref:Late n=1 Tax=Abeliophyllum distichum TaxID=126358 RepID=A0ABD1QY21_9LAMI
MFKNLPRHQFGNLQNKMFLAYFSMVGVYCAMAVGAFGYLHSRKTSAAAEKYQLGFLLAVFPFNLSNLVVFTPMTIDINTIAHFFPNSTRVMYAEINYLSYGKVFEF